MMLYTVRKLWPGTQAAVASSLVDNCYVRHGYLTSASVVSGFGSFSGIKSKDSGLAMQGK